MRDTQMKMTYGRFSVYSEPFSSEPPPSQEVLDAIGADLNERFAIQAQIPIGAEIICEYVEATVATGMHGFFKTLVEDATPSKEQS
ncbi:hypothetical protein [Streptomyces parvus]|uniref:hypothetical protein n=1 Tax=Streptomyces parvus TaxID=66428 RepID=UPI0033EFD2BA